MSRLHLTEALARAEAYRGLGRPIPEEARFRALKRLEATLTYPFLRRQLRYNAAVADALVHLRNGLDQPHAAAPVAREAFAAHHEGIAAVRRDMVALQQQVVALSEQVHASESRTLSMRAHIDQFLGEFHRARPELPADDRIAALPRAWDGLYAEFEDTYRGSFDDITERLRIYVPDLPTDLHDAAGEPFPVLDVGCGRGEWLALMASLGRPAYGVDNNPEVAKRAADRGLDVRTEDALVHLRELAPGSLSAVTGFHLAEHLDIETLVTLVDLALHAVAPGGRLILETPNPDNLVVGASTFYLDPTHRNPLPSTLLSFIVGTRGFSHVEIRALTRSDPPLPPAADGDPLAPVVDVLNRYLGGAQDYAVLGTKE